jgi:hypothetical protein
VHPSNDGCRGPDYDVGADGTRHRDLGADTVTQSTHPRGLLELEHWLLKRPHIKARIEKLAAEMRE